MNEMRQQRVQCLSPAGLHQMAYVEWGDPANPRVLVCVHGLTRCGRDFDFLAAALADHYRVALLNSKNAWRILGQESYAFEVAQWYDWNMRDKVVFVPIGNAGNITAIMSGFLKLLRLNEQKRGEDFQDRRISFL